MAHPTSHYRILCLFSAVGAIGSGNGGGVEITLRNVCQALRKRGHHLEVLAPHASVLAGIPLIPIEGNLQESAELPNRKDPVSIPSNAVLANMLDYAFAQQRNYDVIINFGYDWLPFYLTSYFHTPLLHYVNMSSQTEVLDDMIRKVAQQFPLQLGMQTQSQADTFAPNLPHFRLTKGFDLSRYHYLEQSEPCLAWAGRIISVKGLKDAFIVADRLKLPLKIMGALCDETYWNQITADYSHVSYRYLEYLETEDFQAELRTCLALLAPIKWEEAFGNVVAEAFACGVPVVGYQRGSLPELVQDGKTGWLVEPDNVEALIQAVQKVNKLQRSDCRAYVEEHHSLEAMADCYENWIQTVLDHR